MKSLTETETSESLRRSKGATKVGTLGHIQVNNLVSYNTTSRLSSILSDIPDYQIENVKISNMCVQHIWRRNL